MMAVLNWNSIRTCPTGVDVWTKIDDEKGERNVCVLRFDGKLFWSGGTYVYYTPTHWARK